MKRSFFHLQLIPIRQDRFCLDKILDLQLIKCHRNIKKNTLKMNKKVFI
jgi:hypothetical protein